MTDIRQGDVGTVIRLIVQDQDGEVYDLSSADVKTISFKDPVGTVTPYALEFEDDGEDGVCIFTDSTGIFTSAGEWEYQAYFETSSGKFHTNTFSLTVKENLS